MEFIRKENAQGVFLPNDKAAGQSGGLLVHRWSFVVVDGKCRAFAVERIAPWAAGTGSPAGSPYNVGVRGPTEIHRNEVIEDTVSVTIGLNI